MATDKSKDVPLTSEHLFILGKIQQAIDDMVVSNRHEHGDIRADLKRAEDKIEANVRSSLFFWVMSGVFVCMLILGGLIFDLRDRFESHIDAGEKYLLQQTGEDHNLR